MPRFSRRFAGRTAPPSAVRYSPKMGDAHELKDALARARARAPRIDVDDEEFSAWVRERLPADDAVDLVAVDLDGLLVAHGCLVGAAGALAVFEQELMPAIAHAIARADVPDPDGLVATVRELMLLDVPGRPSKLAAYRGTGPLRAFVRVCAVREALMARRRGRRTIEVPDDQAIADIVGLDPELELIKSDASQAFRQAFSAALAQLPDRDRNVLRYHVVDGLRGDEVATIYGVHPSSVSRWLAAARNRLLQLTRERLSLELALNSGEFESLMRLIASRVDISLGPLG